LSALIYNSEGKIPLKPDDFIGLMDNENNFISMGAMNIIGDLFVNQPDECRDFINDGNMMKIGNKIDNCSGRLKIEATIMATQIVRMLDKSSIITYIKPKGFVDRFLDSFDTFDVEKIGK
jgi:hypothetical protein